MNIVTALKEGNDLQRGRAQAAKQLKLIEAFETNHQAHHASDHDWDCTAEHDTFYNTLAAANQKKFGYNEVVHFGYQQVLDKWKMDNPGRFGNPVVIQLEKGSINFDDDPETINQRLQQAVEDHFNLQQFENDEKEGK